MLEQNLEFFQSACDAFSRGVFGASEDFSYGPKIALLEEPQENRGAVFRIKLIDCFVNNRRNLGKVGLRVILQLIHFDSLPFTIAAAAFSAHSFGRDKTRVTVQPAAEHDA